MLLAAGTLTHSFSRAMMHDETVFPEPLVFRPERHLGKVDSDLTNPINFVFGFGRRICPGAHWAQAQMFVNMASILSAFTIECPKSPDGEPVVPLEQWTTGTTS
jgi:cytochrome P450